MTRLLCVVLGIVGLTAYLAWPSAEVEDVFESFVSTDVWQGSTLQVDAASAQLIDGGYIGIEGFYLPVDARKLAAAQRTLATLQAPADRMKEGITAFDLGAFGLGQHRSLRRQDTILASWGEKDGRWYVYDAQTQRVAWWPLAQAQLLQELGQPLYSTSVAPAWSDWSSVRADDGLQVERRSHGWYHTAGDRPDVGRRIRALGRWLSKLRYRELIQPVWGIAFAQYTITTQAGAVFSFQMLETVAGETYLQMLGRPAVLITPAQWQEFLAIHEELRVDQLLSMNPVSLANQTERISVYRGAERWFELTRYDSEDDFERGSSWSLAYQGQRYRARADAALPLAKRMVAYAVKDARRREAVLPEPQLNNASSLTIRFAGSRLVQDRWLQWRDGKVLSREFVADQVAGFSIPELAVSQLIDRRLLGVEPGRVSKVQFLDMQTSTEMGRLLRRADSGQWSQVTYRDGKRVAETPIELARLGQVLQVCADGAAITVRPATATDRLRQTERSLTVRVEPAAKSIVDDKRQFADTIARDEVFFFSRSKQGGWQALDTDGLLVYACSDEFMRRLWRPINEQVLMPFEPSLATDIRLLSVPDDTTVRVSLEPASGSWFVQGDQGREPGDEQQIRRFLSALVQTPVARVEPQAVALKRDEAWRIIRVVIPTTRSRQQTWNLLIGGAEDGMLPCSVTADPVPAHPLPGRLWIQADSLSAIWPGYRSLVAIDSLRQSGR